ncbi:hypothetical protein JD974_12530 [Chromobacterium haemolyticum]|uniref:Uncharacterized protein n=1 Tax=Chromobacterium haemolyticum TaxID=394935 RepID=A0ABS3GNC0_9NEIS|nr:hypothetical protein [Chromobacterium haemolyticum]MBK0415232.1 hypothetical protein [Chromobacterium haemolyticum]MBO0416553.1 hypothetical protein [Chromobacterium haemolyticum]MBO0499871.1 hypothetical protein [Chromobacterium haemolyticum]
MDLTNESWSYVTHSWEETSILDAAGTRVAVIRISPEVTEDNQQELEGLMEAQARRIVACVNACKGVDTVRLEDEHAQGYGPREHVQHLKSNREYLHALSVHNILLRVVPGYDGMGQEVYAKSVDEVVNLLSEYGMRIEELESQRDQAWAELRTIREAIGANPAESTLDEVASKLTYNDGAVSKLISQRDNLLSALELMVERIAEPPDANCSCHLSPPCNDCVDYGGEREAFETAKAEIAEARNAK